jgi:SAM-dependent methyltransferase
MGQCMFDNYPKTRPALPEAYQAVYFQHYADNRAGRGSANSLAQRAEGWMHKQVAARGRPGEEVLDFGAGNLNHLKWENAGYARYDIVEPFTALLADAESRPSGPSDTYNFVHDINGRTYDRIFSVAVLEHLEALPRDVAKCATLLKPDGLFQAGIPCEGELGWTLGYLLSTGLAFRRKYGLDYRVIMHHEHVNNYRDIVEVVRALFRNVTVRRSPFPLPVPHGSFYAYVEASDPDLALAQQLLAR